MNDRDPMLDRSPMCAGDTSQSLWGPPDQRLPRTLTIYEVAERDGTPVEPLIADSHMKEPT